MQAGSGRGSEKVDRGRSETALSTKQRRGESEGTNFTEMSWACLNVSDL